MHLQGFVAPDIALTKAGTRLADRGDPRFPTRCLTSTMTRRPWLRWSFVLRPSTPGKLNVITGQEGGEWIAQWAS